MTKQRVAALLLGIGLVGLVVLIARSPNPTSDIPAGHEEVVLGADDGGVILEEREVPDLSQFDPVATRGIPQGRSLPPTNVTVNDPSGESIAIVQSEVAIWVNGDDVVIGWNDGRAFQGVGTLSGYGYSRDRGDTWTDGGWMPEGTDADIFGDPTLVTINDGTWIYASLDTEPPQGVAINMGTFVGGVMQWTPSLKYTAADQLHDKEWISYDSSLDRLYLAYTRNGIRFTRSDDGGFTWASELLVYDGLGPTGAHPIPGPDGDLYVAFADPIGTGSGSVFVRYSDNGGESFLPGVRVVNALFFGSGDPPRCFNRDFNPRFPGIGVDRSSGPNRGRLYVTYTNGNALEFDCFIKRSDNHGGSFAGQVRLNDNDNAGETESFWPAVTVGPNGRVTAGWYDRRNDPSNSLTDFYITQSVDGGVTFGPNRRASDLSVAWCGVPFNLSPNFGDYIDITSDERSVFCTWADARNGGPDVIFSRFDDVHDLTVSGDVSQPAPVAGGGTAWVIPNEAEITISPAGDVSSNAQMTVVGLALSSLATPAEEDGIWQLSNEDLSASLTLTALEGVVTGTFGLARTGPTDVSLDFTAVSDPLLDAISFTDDWSADATWTPNGVGSVSLTGTLVMSDGTDDIEFIIAGVITLDGNPTGALTVSHDLDHTASVAVDGADLTLHARTLVSDGIIIAVEPSTPAANPFPQFTVKASPNPYQATTRIVYSIDRPMTGKIQVFTSSGKLVRTIAEGEFAEGRNEFPFDGRDDRGRDLASGGYFLKLQTEFGTANGKLFVVR